MNRKWLPIFLFLPILLFCFYLQKNKNLEIVFCDVGQGDAILIKSFWGQNILIDGGPNSRILECLDDNLPFWDKKIDLMILTHPHDDHVVGLIDVLKYYAVQEIIYTGIKFNSDNYNKWLAVASQERNIHLADEISSIILGNNCWLQIFYPTLSINNTEIENVNNASIVLMLFYGENRFLFMGDAEKEVEEYILTNNIDVKADVLKIGHHGSDNSSSWDFLQAVQPKISIISVGQNNMFNHPSLLVLERLQRLKSLILRTDINKTIHLFANISEIWLGG